MASKFEVNPNQITRWKKEFLVGAENVLSKKRPKKFLQAEAEKEQIYNKIGRLKT